jgi:hypothetical protein
MPEIAMRKLPNIAGPGRRSVVLSLAGLLAGGLAACNQSVLPSLDARPAELVVAPETAISIDSLDVADESTAANLRGALGEAAAARKISLVGADAQPKYRLKAYFALGATADGKSALRWVLDVYDDAKVHARRIEGDTPAGSGGWSGVTAAVSKSAAEAGMNEVAAFLSRNAGERRPAVAGR